MEDKKLLVLKIEGIKQDVHAVISQARTGLKTGCIAALQGALLQLERAQVQLQASTDIPKVCKGCGRSMKGKHPNARFHSKKCKDTYWNEVNPRGKFAHLKNKEYDPHDDIHPFSLEAFSDDSNS